MPSPLDRHVKFEVRLPSDHPQLLEGLDTWLRLGLMSDAQAKQLCREFLVCPVVLQPQTQAGGVAVATSNPRQKRLITSPQQGQETAAKTPKTKCYNGDIGVFKGGIERPLAAVFRYFPGSDVFWGTCRQSVGKLSRIFAVWGFAGLYLELLGF